MGRTKLPPKRAIEIKKENIGRIIIFCEGMTEKRYFDYFTAIINKNKFTDIHVEIESVNGNSQTVLNFAENYLAIASNNQKYVNYNKYLVFDCDDPPNIQQVILDMQASSNNYNLLVSNLLFEVWLLMHFEIIDRPLTKRHIYERLQIHLKKEYKKAETGTIREIIQNGNIDNAIQYAEILNEKYKSEGKSISSNILEMNSYTNVHELVQQLMLEIS